MRAHAPAVYFAGFVLVSVSAGSPASTAHAQETSPDSAAAVSQSMPSAPQDVTALDTPNDGGRSITLRWSAAPDAPADATVLIERVAEDGAVAEAARVPLADGTFADSPTSRGAAGPPDAVPFTYRLTTISSADTTARSAPAVSAPAVSKPQFFNTERINVLLLLGTFFVFVLVNVQRAARGEKIHVRKLQPVVAIEEAIGRATEMGRPVLYVPGIEEVDDIQTVASMGILGKVAEMTARYDVALRVPTARPFVMAVADEVVRAGCLQAGRPDAYQPDRIQFISTEQFAYCAGVNGIILREKPAANLYLGKFFAESLIFAETGFAAGSIQIAGTAEVTQLPFFIAACDYTLIGEEFFAAGAYLTQDSALLSTLAAADWTKILLIGLLIAGTILQSAGMPEFAAWFVVR